MKKKLLTAATSASLCVAAGGAFADQPVNKPGPAEKEQWDLQHYITVCSNNGQGNNHETVSTGMRCLKFVNSNTEDLGTNNNTGPACANTADCDPKPE